MPGTIKVSVIIPCYNVEEYIESAVDSAFKQTYKELEVICVDNNSTDSTKRVLCKLKNVYPELIVISELKRGASAARNKGLALAKGEWIQFLDADDIIEPTKIKNQISLITKSIENKFIAGSSRKECVNGSVSYIFLVKTTVWEALTKNQLGNTCSNLFNKNSLHLVGGWNEDLFSSQESDLMFRLLKNGSKVIFDPEPLTIIRERETGSISQINLEENLIRYINLRCEILSYLNSVNESQIVKENIQNTIFDKIRELYNYNPEKSLRLYNQVIPKSFRPKVSAATTKGFLIAYHLFGFRRAQFLKTFLKS